MSDTSNGDTSCSTANNNELDSNLNKKDSEKKRREQENLCIEELAMLISAQLPEFSDSDDSSGGPEAGSKFEKGSILQETVEKLKRLKAESAARWREVQREEVTSSQSVLPREILGSLVLEALDGFMFIGTMSSDGKIDFVSDNVFDYLGFKQDSLTEHVIYNFIHHGDHARFSVNLEPNSWKTWKKLPQSAATGKQTGFDRSKVFNLRFLQNNDAKAESLDDRYENMQVSAIVMLNPEERPEDPKAGLFCIARRISPNERSGLTPVEQFTTKADIRDHTLIIESVDTEGLPELFRKNISGHVLGKTLVDLVHPHDRPLIKEHVEGVLSRTTDTSRVYRMVLPPPQNVVHVKTKTKDFRPQGGSSHPGYVMSTHAIIRENELMIEDLPALRPELRGLEGGGEGGPGEPRPAPPRSEMLEKLLSPPPVSQSFPGPVNRVPANGSSGNQLLKELLRPKESEAGRAGAGEAELCRTGSGTGAGLNSPEETITIGQILNEKRQEGGGPLETSELLKQLRKPPESLGRISELAQLLQRGSPATTAHPELKRAGRGEDGGPAAKQPVPSLEKLLAVRPDRSITPPPMPRKWSEIPQEKLPRDIVTDSAKQYKDGPGRTARSPGTALSPAPAHTLTAHRTIVRAPGPRSAAHLPDPAASLTQLTDTVDASDFNDLLTDPAFSRILDTLGSGLGFGMPSEEDQAGEQNRAKQRIHDIEQSLKSVEQSFSPGSGGGGGQAGLGLSGAGPGPGRHSASTGGVIAHGGQYGVGQQRILQPRGGGEGGVRSGAAAPHRSAPPGTVFHPPGPRSPSLQANMEELLKGIPPNVAIKTLPDQPPGGAGLRTVLERQPPVRHLSGEGGVGREGGAGQFSGNRSHARHASGGGERQLGAGVRRPSGEPGMAVQGSYAILQSQAEQTGQQRPGPGIPAQAARSVRAAPGGPGRRAGGPGGRALSQEDLEAFGLSIEVAGGDFRQPGAGPGRAGGPGHSSYQPAGQGGHSPAVQQFSPGFPGRGAGPGAVQYSPGGQQQQQAGAGPEQFSPRPGQPQPAAQFSPHNSQQVSPFSPQFSPQSGQGSTKQQQQQFPF